MTCFYALNSMDFFHHLDRQQMTLDLVLVDGNHDFEFALFDLQMSARLLRPGGIVIMDNAEQTGPFKASQLFLANNREWCELGSAVASHTRSAPFDSVRASIPWTSFIILQAPRHIPVGEDLRSWGQVRTKSAHFDGIRLELPAQRTSGWLHYQAMLRAFLDDGSVPEHKAIGKVRIEVDDTTSIGHPFDPPLRFPEGAQYTYEVDLAWEADDGCPPLALSSGANTPLAYAPADLRPEALITRSLQKDPCRQQRCLGNEGLSPSIARAPGLHQHAGEY